jgi:hypothetical protein
MTTTRCQLVSALQSVTPEIVTEGFYYGPGWSEATARWHCRVSFLCCLREHSLIATGGQTPRNPAQSATSNRIAQTSILINLRSTQVGSPRCDLLVRLIGRNTLRRAGSLKSGRRGGSNPLEASASSPSLASHPVDLIVLS